MVDAYRDFEQQYNYDHQFELTIPCGNSDQIGKLN